MATAKKTSLVPFKDEQLNIVCYATEQKVMETRQWNSYEKALGSSSTDLLSVDMSITQAPPSFRQPVTQKKAFLPPFKIQIAVHFGHGSSQLPVKVNAYSLGADSLASFLKQSSQNGFASLPSECGLANASISKCIENHYPDADQSVTETFEFVDMHFKTSSRMALRWILFVARVQEDLIFALYKHPTIVLSRKTDQYCKASCILSKGNPVLEISDRSSLSASQTMPQSSSSCNKDILNNSRQPSIPHDVKEWILAVYNDFQFRRPLSIQDVVHLGSRLGIRNISANNIDEPWILSREVEDQQRFEGFASWYLSCLNSLKRETALWCSADAMRICPFMVDRSYCENLLRHEAIGTFVIRISSEPGCFVLSIKELSLQGEFIDHVLIDALDLKRHSLSWWVMANQSAQLFLDVKSGAAFPKHFIFIESMIPQSHFITEAHTLGFDSLTDSDCSISLNRRNYGKFCF